MPIDLRSHLRSAYSRASWGTVLEDLFPSGSLHLLQFPEHIAAPCEHVLRTQQLGSVQLPDGNSIALLEVDVEDQVQLARNRVALRNFVAKFIDEAATQAVLAVFHQPGKGDWRLTYASKRSQLDEDTLEITSVQTAPRRYTFLLGENEPCRTAAGRLAEIRERDEHLTLEDVEKAFSVERLNKEFFKLYKEHYDRFVAHLLAPDRVKAVRTAFGVPFIRDDDAESTAAAQDKADKPIRDFVKRLLGRLVFLHFLQKKGWMGCKPGGKAWTGGDTDFLASYFALAEAKGEADQFHSRWLLPLFFEALNKDHDERPGHLFAPTGTRIPYLNGGLFEASEVEQALLSASSKTPNSGQECPRSLLDFPAAHFRALLEFFGQYHFTIDENDPEDHEVGIDPEMLGHIFENLLEDNKDKGAYYTPKAIVSYMARQSLLHYLQTHLGENAELNTLLNEKDLTRLEKNGFVHQHAKRIAELLDAVKVCDPAIGSGAFPIGVLQEILWTRLALDWTLNTPEDRARLKRQIIQNSIHGVDLDPGAVEIARLRFWLCLVVDEKQPQPLPNLDYKIMQGDGLLEWFEGIDLSKISEAGGGQSPYMMTFLDGGTELNLGASTSGGRLVTAQTPASDLPQMMKSYFNCRKPTEKKRLHREIDRTVLDHLKHCVDALIEKTEALIDQQRKVIAGKLIRPKNWHPSKAEKLISGLKDRLNELKVAREKLVNLYEHHTRPFFLWHLLFQSVFKEGGFDIVIANPPYVRADNPDALVERKKVEATGLYQTLWEKWDLYVAFIERGHQLLKPGGTLCNIVSDAYCHSKYAQKSQDWFLKNARVLRLDFLADLKVFDAAVRNVICFYQKADGQDYSPERRIHRQRFANVTELPTQRQHEASYRLFFPGEKKTAEFDVETVPLEDICYISKGMVAHADEKVCKGAFKLEDLVADKKSKTHPKPFAEGKHLSRWAAATHKWIEWDTNRAPALFSRPTFPELYAVPEKLISVDISAGAGKLRVAYDENGLLHNHSAWSFVPWHYLKGVTNRSLAKQAKYRRERPSPTDRSREGLETLSEAFEAKYLLAVMNSNVARDWIMSRRRSNLHLYPDDWKPLPVPKADKSTQKRIVKLVDHVLKSLRGNIQSDITDLETAIEGEIAALYHPNK